MSTVVYVLCALTSLACAVLVARAHLRDPSSILRWTTACFVLLAISDAMLVVDLSIIGDTTDLAPWRNAIAMVGLLALLYGLLRDAAPRDAGPRDA